MRALVASRSLWLVVAATLAGCAGGEEGSPVAAASDDSGGGFAIGGGWSDVVAPPPGEDTASPEADVAPPIEDGDEQTVKDAPAPDADADLVDTAEPACGYGSVYGLICSFNEQTFVDGATVWIDTVDCDGAPLHLETVSDGDGYYSLEGVPTGLQTVRIKRDDFEKTQPVLVHAGKVADVTGVAHKECYQYVDPDACTAGKQNINVEAKTIEGLADIIWFVDTSGSMEQESAWTQQNINEFASYIGQQSIGYRVVLIAKGFDLCVPPPLGGPSCTDGPAFRHVKQPVGSHDGLEVVVDTYEQYADFLQPGATTNFIAVTDDNSDKSASWFEGKVAQKPAISDPFVFHSIVGMGSVPFVGCLGAAFGGIEYLALSDKTGGAKFPVCNTDWSSIFDAIAETVVSTVQASCGYTVPNPAALANASGLTLTHEGSSFPQVSGSEACGPAGGWYLDDEGGLFLCKASCDGLEGGILELTTVCD